MLIAFSHLLFRKRIPSTCYSWTQVSSQAPAVEPSVSFRPWLRQCRTAEIASAALPPSFADSLVALRRPTIATFINPVSPPGKAFLINLAPAPLLPCCWSRVRCHVAAYRHRTIPAAHPVVNLPSPVPGPLHSKTADQGAHDTNVAVCTQSMTA